jgi:hypothetical protein
MSSTCFVTTPWYDSSNGFLIACPSTGLLTIDVSRSGMLGWVAFVFVGAFVPSSD